MIVEAHLSAIDKYDEQIDRLEDTIEQKVLESPAACEIVVRGTKGGAILDIDTQELRIYPSPDSDSKMVEIENQDWLAPEVAAFAEAVSEGTPLETESVDQALTVQRALSAVYHSESNGESVHLS